MKYAEVIEILDRYPQRPPRQKRPVEAAIELRERLKSAGVLRAAGPLDRSYREVHPATPLGRGALIALDQEGIDEAARTIWCTTEQRHLPDIVVNADLRVADRLRELAQRHGRSLERGAAG